MESKSNKLLHRIGLDNLKLYVQLVLVVHTRIGPKKEKLLQLKTKEIVDHVQHLQLQLVDKVT